MKPTLELRFIDRETGVRLMDENGYFYMEAIRTLQQRWVKANYYCTDCTKDEPLSEWRDVPVEY